MGEAKQRGSFEERAATAVRELNLVELRSGSEEFKSAKQIADEAGIPKEFMITMILKSSVTDIPVPVLFFVNLSQLENGCIRTEAVSIVPIDNPRIYNEKLTKMNKLISSEIHRYAMERYQKAPVKIIVC